MYDFDTEIRELATMSELHFDMRIDALERAADHDVNAARIVAYVDSVVNELGTYDPQL